MGNQIVKHSHVYTKYSGHGSIETREPFQITYLKRKGEAMSPRQGGGDFQKEEEIQNGENNKYPLSLGISVEKTFMPVLLN